MDATSPPSTACVTSYEALYQLLTNSLKAHERSPIMVARSQVQQPSSSIGSSTAVLRLFDGPTESATGTDLPAGSRSPRTDAIDRPAASIVSTEPPWENVSSLASLAPSHKVWKPQGASSPAPAASPRTPPPPPQAISSTGHASSAASSSAQLPPLASPMASSRSGTSDNSTRGGGSVQAIPSGHFPKPPKATGTKKSDETALLLQVIEEQRSIIEKLVQSNENLQQQFATHQQRMDTQEHRFRDQEARLASAEAALIAQRRHDEEANEPPVAGVAVGVGAASAWRPTEARDKVGECRSSGHQVCEAAAQTLPMTRSSSCQTAIGWSGRLRSPSRDEEIDAATERRDDAEANRREHNGNTTAEVAIRSHEVQRPPHAAWSVPTQRRSNETVAHPLPYHPPHSAVPCAFADHSVSLRSHGMFPSSRLDHESGVFRSPRRTTESPPPHSLTPTEALWTLRYSPFLSRESHSRIQHLVGRLYGME